MVEKRSQRFWRYGIHRIRPDQVFHVHDVRIIGILGPCTAIQNTLYMSTPFSEMRPAFTMENFLVTLIGHLCISNTDPAFQSLRFRCSDLVEQFIYFGIYTTDEKRSNRGN